MLPENFRQIQSYPNYCIDQEAYIHRARVLPTRKNEVMRHSGDRPSWYRLRTRPDKLIPINRDWVWLFKDKKRYREYIWPLYTLAWIGPQPDDWHWIAGPKDGDWHHYAIDNIAWHSADELQKIKEATDNYGQDLASGDFFDYEPD